MAEEVRKFSAFISYKHGDLDTFAAENLHKAIETFRVPRNIQKMTGKKEIERVFRDKDELPISSNLADNISLALQNSEYLIVICSPRTPESYWVQKEIETFIQMHDRDHVLAVLIEGEPEESFPERLRFVEEVRILPDGTEQVERIPVEPLAADLRSPGKREMKKLLKTEILRIMAPLLGCGYDDLRQRHRERKMHRTIGISAALSVCFLAFGLYSMYNTMQINQQYRVKQINQSRYLAETSQRLLNEGNRELAVKIAMEALPEYEGADNRPYVAEAEYALSEALGVYADGYEFRAERQLVCDAGIEEMAISLDQSLLAVRDSMQNIYVWRVEDFELLNRFEPEFTEKYETIKLQGIGFNSNNQLVCVLENRIECRDVQTGDYVWRIEDIISQKIAFNRDKSLAVVYQLEDVQVIDTITGVITARTDTYKPRSRMIFSPDNRYVVYDIKQEEKVACVVWDLQSGSINLIQDEAWDTYTISDMIFVGKENVIIASSKVNPEIDFAVLGNMTMYHVETLESIWSNDSYAFHLGCYYKGDDTEFENPILVNFLDTDVCSIDEATGTIEASGLPFDVEYAKPITETSYFVVGTEGEVGLLDGTSSGFASLGKVAGVTNMEDCILISETFLYRNRNDNKIMVATRMRGEEFQQCLEGNYISVSSVCTADSSYILIRLLDRILIISNESNEVVDELSLGVEEYGSYKLYQDTNQLIYYDGHGGLHRYDLEERTELENMQVSEDWVKFYTFSYDGRWFALVEEDAVRIYNTKDFTQCISLDGINLENAVIDGEGTYLAGRKRDGTLGVYELPSGNEVKLEEGSLGISEIDVLGEVVITIAHNKPWIAVSGADQWIHVIDMESGKTMHRIDASCADQCFLEFTFDDGMLMIADINSAILFYDLQSGVIKKQVSLENNKIKQVRYLLEQEICILETKEDAYLLTTKDNAYEKIARVPNFLAMDEKTDRIYVDSWRNGFGYFQYQTLDSLIHQGKELVNNEELTELERRTYNME